MSLSMLLSSYPCLVEYSFLLGQDPRFLDVVYQRGLFSWFSTPSISLSVSLGFPTYLVFISPKSLTSF